MKDYKEETREAYDKYAKEFAEKFKEQFEKRTKALAAQYVKLLRQEFPNTDLKVADIGSGPGHHAQYFTQCGINVHCFDLSKKMVRMCEAKGLRARVMDLEDLTLPEKNYHGIWAYTSLLHIPKENLSMVRSKFYRVLKGNGLLGIALKQGEGEGFEENPKYPGTRRFVAYYTDDEVRKIFSQYFEMIFHSEDVVGEDLVFLNYIFRNPKVLPLPQQ